jgi:carboxyl-terminal processing protease
MSLSRRSWLALLSSPEDHLTTFEAAWRLIRDLHWDPAHRDWDQLRRQFLPAAQQAVTRDELRQTIHRMIKSLGQSHYGLYPKESFEKAKSRGAATPGFDLRLVDGEALVIRVDPGSPARDAGLTPGRVLLAVDGEPLAERLQKVPESLRATAALAALRGETGQEIEFTFDDGPRRLTLTAAPGRPGAAVGLLPPLPVDCRHRWLDPQTGYLRCSMFFDPEFLATGFQAAIDEFHEKARGLVIDLRGNPGGLGALAMGLAGWFVQTPGQYLGTMRTREIQLRFTVNPRLPYFPGRLAILTDALTGSTSEIYAAGLRDLGRARLFGERTAGAVLPSQFRPLPNGDVLQVAFATYTSAQGQVLEASGVTPDAIIPWSKTALRAGRDATLDAAQAWCRE